jgi:hypothetical protein
LNLSLEAFSAGSSLSDVTADRAHLHSEGDPGTKPIPRQVGAETDTVWSMPEWKKGWTPATVGEAREYLDAHERDGDPAIVKACEAKVDATVRRPQPGKQGRGKTRTAPVAKPPLEQLEEKGAD